ncbi:hypothetical protein GOP47_0023362 [Adiantum capillus-veneris]|uniref:Pentatricopeptide repeat-containing protein n=1 Tax=Adiantum capillus-veneris TaxID=13818 RepID=A0A9D4U3R6_ADICA|nr:hypothetical protein GOP47_0023362 [Adiantum capillus-veneris]
MEAGTASQMHNLSFSSRAASCSDKRLLRACRTKKSTSNSILIGPRKTSAVVSLEEKEEVAKETKHSTSLKNAEIAHFPSKKVWKLPSRRPRQDPHSTWAKMMRDIQEVDSPVTVLHGYHKAGKLSKEGLVGTLLRLKQLKEWKHITEIIGWLKHQKWWTITELDYNLQLVAYAKIGEPGKVKKTLNSMKKAGFQPNVASYTSLIEAYGNKGLFYEAEGILNQMLEEGPKPTALTYQTIIGALVKGHRYEDADRIFKDMESDNIVKPDQKLCNLMIHSYGKRGMIDEALHLSRKMKAVKIPLSIVTFNTLLSCQRSVDAAESVFKQMQRNNIEPDVITYAARIGAFARARRAEEAQYFFKVMLDSGIRPNRTVYNVLLDAYANCRMPAEAEAVLKDMKRDKCSPDVHSYTTLMNAYVNACDMAKAEKIFERMKGAQIEPNIVTYGTIIKGYADRGDLDAMMKKYDEMIGKQIKINQTVFTTMLQAFGKYVGLDRAKDWFQEVVSSGLEPDVRAQNTLRGLSDPLHRRAEIEDFLDNLP